MKPKGPLTTEEQAEVKTRAADGQTVYRISKALNRSPHTIKAFLSKPETVKAVANEKAELADLYRAKAKTILEAIDEATILKAGLRDRAVSSGIFLDKSLVLSGELPSLDVHVLLELAAVVRGDRDRAALPPALPALPEGPK